MSAESNSPLKYILEEMARTHNAGLFYAAAVIALTLPDICSKLEKDPASEEFWRGTQSRYEEWCQTYLAHRLSNLTPQDLWCLRGGVLHQGQTFGHPKARYGRVIFVLPINGNIFEMSTGAVGQMPNCCISITKFCQDFHEAAMDWIAATKDNQTVQQNADGLVRLRPQGFGGDIVGMPVIT